MSTFVVMVDINGFAMQDLRLLAGITRAEMARKLEVGTAYVRHLENGSRNRVSEAVYQRIVDALGCHRLSIRSFPGEARARQTKATSKEPAA